MLQPLINAPEVVLRADLPWRKDPAITVGLRVGAQASYVKLTDAVEAAKLVSGSSGGAIGVFRSTWYDEKTRTDGPAFVAAHLITSESSRPFKLGMFNERGWNIEHDDLRVIVDAQHVLVNSDGPRNWVTSGRDGYTARPPQHSVVVPVGLGVTNPPRSTDKHNN